MTYFIISGITGLIGIVLWFVRGASLKKLQQIVDTPTSTVKQLEDRLHHSKGREANKTYREHAEIKGKIVCEKPLVGELSKQECVYFDTKVTHEYEEYYEEKDAEGNTTKKSRRKSDVMTKDTRRTPFYLEDETGKILVDSDGANVDALQVVNKMEKHPQNNNLAMGNLVLNLTNVVMGNKMNRTIGYRMQEKILPIDRKIYILGEVRDEDGQLVVKKPTTSGQSFLITTKSEEELVRSKQSTAKWTGIISYVFVATAVAFLVLGLKSNM